MDHPPVSRCRPAGVSKSSRQLHSPGCSAVPACGTVHALRGALIFLETHLPPWVFSGVMQWLKVQEMQPPYHEIRWLIVRQGYDEGLDSDDAYDNAVKKLADTPAHCKRSMLMKSYQMVERMLSSAARRVVSRRPRKQRIK
jgi:hypothetical protein